MSGVSFTNCQRGRVLDNPGIVSLDQLQQIMREASAESKEGMFVKFTDYVGLMENFIRASALKKIANDEAAHYRELLVLQERDNAPTSLLQLAALERSLSEMLAAARTVQQCLQWMPWSAEVEASRQANQQLISLMESVCPVQDLVAEMENLSAADNM